MSPLPDVRNDSEYERNTMNTTNNLKSGRKPLWGLLVMGAVLAAIVAAGCGGSSDESTSTETAASTSGEAEAGGTPSAGGPGGFEIDDEAQACLEEQGVELPEMGAGGPPEGGAPPSGEPPQGGPPEGFEGGEEMQKAFEECGIEAPQGGGPGGPPADSPEFEVSIEDYVACVRENGYDLPDPNLSGEGPVFSEAEVDQSDPKFKAASEECQSLIAAPGGGEG